MLQLYSTGPKPTEEKYCVRAPDQRELALLCFNLPLQEKLMSLLQFFCNIVMFYNVTTYAK